MDLTMPSTKSKTTPAYSWQFDGIGTKWEIASARELNAALKQYIADEIESFDAVYSRFRADSLVQKIAQAPGEYTFPKSAEILFDFYDELWEVSHGSVNPLVGDALVAAGYDEVYSLKQRSGAAPALDYNKTLQRSGSKLLVTEKTVIDIGAIGKGFLVDYIAELLKKAGHADVVVDGGGDMRICGTMNEKVGLEHPLNTGQVIGIVDIQNKALCASATNRRAWGDWHHVINAQTGKPTEEIIATWVIADSTMIADGLATALFFVSPQTFAGRYTYEYMRMHADGSVEYSDYFAKGVFS